MHPGTVLRICQIRPCLIIFLKVFSQQILTVLGYLVDDWNFYLCKQACHWPYGMALRYKRCFVNQM